MIVFLLACMPSTDNDTALAFAGPKTHKRPTADVVWPVYDNHGCVQDTFGHRLLSGSDDFHPGWDICDPPSGTVHIKAIARGKVTRVRHWDPDWDSNPENCPSLCRQGTFIQIRHPRLEPAFDGEIVQSVYMHMVPGSVPSEVEVGAHVSAGTRIGTMGNSGTDINTVHLHFSLLAGSGEGLISTANYVHPLRVLPYPPVPAAMSLDQTTDVSMYDVGECPSATGTMALTITEYHPALDTVAVSVLVDGQTLEAKLDGDNSMVTPSTRDDFEQDCVAVSVLDYSQEDATRQWTINWGGVYGSPTTARVIRTTASGHRDATTLPVL